MAEGESLTVQPIGTPGLLLVKNFDFEAPGFDTGAPTDFTTDLAVYQDGQRDRPQDDPGQRPAVDRRLHVPPERLRAGPAPRAQERGRGDPPRRARPHDRRRRRAALRLDRHPRSRHGAASSCSTRRPMARAILIAIPYRVVGTAPDGQPIEDLYPAVDLRARRRQGLGRPGPVDRPDRFRRVHAAHRQARPGPGHRLDRFRLPHRGHHDHVLPAAPPRLDPAGARTAGSGSSGARTATSTSSASSGACSTSSSPSAVPPEPPGEDGAPAGRSGTGTTVCSDQPMLNRNLTGW